MSRECKPGDVAMVRVEGGDFEVLGLRDTHGWAHLKNWHSETHSHSCWVSEAKVTVVRPLVVIDPEDREQVERLVRACPDDWGFEQSEEMVRECTEDMQAALREFANPKPPKPEEPTGLGAVVEDASGGRWVRVGISHDGRLLDNWRGVDGDHIGWWSTYASIAAVRVLSEGGRLMCTCGFALCSDPATSTDRAIDRLDHYATDTALSHMTRLIYAHAAEIVRNEAQR